MNLSNIEAILFDSGRVLNYPITGHWFITPNFFSVVNKDSFESISIERRNIAFAKAANYINSFVFIETNEAEYEYFIKYYEILLNELPELKLDRDASCELAKDLVYNTDKYKFFEDAMKVLPLLKKKFKLAIVSDAWPSLIDVYIKAGLYSYFSSFVISSIMGVTKPNEKMYLTSLKELNIEPGKAVFIDDNIKNCLGAKKVGLKTALLCRDKRYFYIQKVISIGKGYSVIHSLNELIK